MRICWVLISPERFKKKSNSIVLSVDYLATVLFVQKQNITNEYKNAKTVFLVSCNIKKKTLRKKIKNCIKKWSNEKISYFK